MVEFRMPSLGADMESGRLLEWRVKPGDAVHRGDIVAVVDTDKAAIEIEVFCDGVVEKLLVPAGEQVPVGTPLALIRAAAEPAVQAGEIRQVPAAAAPPSPAGPAPQPASQPSPSPGASVTAAGPRASPAARKLARERGVDLAAIAGTGPDAAITVADVERAGAAAPPPVSAMRRTIAAAMSRSKREIPHYYLGTSIDLQPAVAFLEARNAARPVTERLLPAALLIKAVALACREVPEMNGHFADGAFAPSAEVRLGFAVALRGGGLVAPALPAPDRQALDEVMRMLRDVVERARAGRLRSSEIAGQTITVTSLGDRGVESVFGVIHPPQVALVGFGRIAERPWVHDGKVLVRPAVHASLSADHRVSDGHRGAVFLEAVARFLQRPEGL
ncbi:MAG TPA: dihydrolipoamide acetyltransferase family protein [Planctomycetota bacterium]